jgi:ABC-type bacteriocin/lantibiotic exporter with double-glycine peptidase domain
VEKRLSDVKIAKQEGYNLCWAACLEMVLAYFYPEAHIKQCDIVAQMFGLKTREEVMNAETKRYKPNFDQAATADEIIKLGYALDCSIKKITDANLYWATIKIEIDANRPLIANVGFHYVIVWGYLENEDGKYFILNDPKKDTAVTKNFELDGHITIYDELLTVVTRPSGRVCG